MDGGSRIGGEREERERGKRTNLKHSCSALLPLLTV